MKTTIQQLTVVLMLCFAFNAALAQRYLNEEFSSITGLPVNIHWSASLIASTGHYMTVGNTYTTGQSTNMLFTKQATNGAVVWQVEYDNPDNLEDYGIGLLEDSNGDFYVIGTSFRSASSSLDLAVLKYDASGQLQWDYFFNGSASGDDIPASAAIDQNNLVITGVTESTNNLSDYVTIKLKNDGTQLWTTLYDHAQLNDAAIKVSVDQSGHVIVTGGSASQVNLYDAAILKYDANGNQINEHRSNYNIGISELTAHGVDGSGNVITGGHYLPTGASDLELSLISLNDTLGYNWHVNTNPSGGEDKIMDMVVAPSGDIYITGHIEESPGYFKLYTAKFSSSGTLEWEATYESINGGAFGKQNTMDVDGNLNIAGMTYSESDTNIITLQYSPGGELLFSKEHDAGGAEIASNIDTDNWGNIYVHGTTSINSNSYVTVKYATFDRDFSTVNPGGFEYVDNEVLVQFRPSATIQSAFDNEGKTFGQLSDFITSAAIDEMNEAFEGQYNFGRFQAVKAFPGLTPNNTLSVTRQGDTIEMYHFWSTLVMIVPSSLDENSAAQALNTMNDVADYAEYNLVGKPFDIPNDSVYQAGDQDGLESSNSPENDINMDRAWDVYHGSIYSRVGVYDSGIDFDHPDFSKTGQLTFADSKIAGGKDFTTGANGTPVPSGSGDVNGHGTLTAGIVGAIRNNGIGVASVAGGDAAQGNFGCQLIDMKIFPDNGQLTQVSLDRACNAMIEGARDFGQGGYKLHVLNHSWGIEPGNSQGLWTAPNRTLMHKTNKTVYDNGAVNVCARGNDGTQQAAIPATAGPDHFMIAVGASGLQGNKTSASSFGLNVDLIAPGHGLLTYSTQPYSQAVNSFYWRHDGTSAAAPHVAGVAALLTGQANDPDRWIPGPGLYPDDLEQLMEIYRTPNQDSLYSNVNGWGRLNAGELMEHMEWPHYYVKPFNGSTTNYTATKVDSNVTLNVSENFDDLSITQGFYTGDIYKIVITVTHSLGSDSLLNGWIRNGASHSTLFSDSTDIFDIPLAQLDTFSETQAVISGFIFHLKQDNQSNTISQWLPTANGNPIKYGYSLHVFDSLATGVNNPENANGDPQFYAWPNPTDDAQTLVIPPGKNMNVVLVDMHGRVIKPVYTGSNREQTRVRVNLQSLPQGVYFYRLTSEDITMTYKFIRLE